ncbi:Hypothetical predicted protein, partial [Marmota monax]
AALAAPAELQAAGPAPRLSNYSQLVTRDKLLARRSPFHSHPPEANHRNRRRGRGEEGQRVATLRPLLPARVTPASAAAAKGPPPAELPEAPRPPSAWAPAGGVRALTPSSGPRRCRAAVTWALPSAGLRGIASQSGSKSPARSRRGLGHRRAAAGGWLGAASREAAGRTRAATATAGAGGSGPE